MSNVFETKDPRGINVYCTQDQWKNHIILEPTGHPEMKDNIPAIIETIKNPDYIGESTSSEPPLNYREVYCKEVEFATYHSKTPITKVVVSILGGSGEVVTAYNAPNLTGGTKGEVYVADKTN